MIALVLTIGCEMPPLATQPAETATPALGRLGTAYGDDLANKRFQVIADFEEPEQGTLFHLEPSGDPAAVAVTTARAQQDTGVGSLRMALANSRQHVVAADTPGGKWALHSDWAPYPLLLFSVFSPRDQGGFRFSIRSGKQNPLTYEHPRIFLKTGWNRIRVDLAEVAERVYLGDIREMQFWCDPLDTPIDLYLDDLILTDNTRDLLVPAHPRPGDLSVRSQGRRLVVTAHERFQLVFNRGQIRQWFDLGSDPQRLHNLAGGGVIGPIPVLIQGDHSEQVALDNPAPWNKLGPLVETYQTVIDTSALRVVVHGEWRFGTATGTTDESSPFHRWVYSIYRDGDVYVECTGAVPGDDGTPAEVGMAVTCDGASGFTRVLAEDRRSSVHPGGDPGFVLFAQAEANRPDLLVVPAAPLRVQTLDNPQDPRQGALFRLPIEGDEFVFAGLMRFWPTDMDSPAQALPMAASYAQPLPLAVDTGRLVPTDPGDFNHDGFSEARGYYVLHLDGRVGRLRIDGRDHLRFAPAFKLIDVADQDVWVYADGRQIKETPRDGNGNLLFKLPGVVSREVLVEITSSSRTMPAVMPPVTP